MLTVALALIYWIGLGTLVSLSRQGSCRRRSRSGCPIMIFAVFGMAMLTRLEKPGDRDIIGSILGFFRELQSRAAAAAGAARSRSPAARKYCWAAFLWFRRSSTAMCWRVSCFTS